SIRARSRAFRRARSLLGPFRFGDELAQVLEIFGAHGFVLQQLRKQRTKIVAEEPAQERLDQRLTNALAFDGRRVDDRAAAVRDALDRAFLLEPVDDRLDGRIGDAALGADALVEFWSGQLAVAPEVRHYVELELGQPNGHDGVFPGLTSTSVVIAA